VVLNAGTSSCLIVKNLFELIRQEKEEKKRAREKEIESSKIVEITEEEAEQMKAKQKVRVSGF